MRTTQVQLELKLEREAKGKKKGLCKYTRSRKKTNENAGSLLSGAGDLVTRGMEKLNYSMWFFFLTFHW